MTAAALSAIALLALTGCTTPAPADPTPTPPFASEEEAFAAAEETYRAYVDALNQVDLSDPETFEPMFDWTVGEMNGTDRKQFSEWHAEHLTKSGDARIGAVELDVFDSATGEIVLSACYDVANVDIRDAKGDSLVSTERPDVQPLSITLVPAPRREFGLAIASIENSGSGISC